MKKTSAAALALAATLAASGAAQAAEQMIQADFEISTSNDEPKLDEQGNIVIDQDGNPEFTGKTTYGPKLREAKACFANKDGAQFTLSVRYLLAASVQDMGIEIKKGTPMQEMAAQILQKFPPAQADKAADYVEQAWQAVASRHKLEEVATATPSQGFMEDLQATFKALSEGKRVNPEVKSFEEESGITIAAAGIMPGAMSRGCAPKP